MRSPCARDAPPHRRDCPSARTAAPSSWAGPKAECLPSGAALFLLASQRSSSSVPHQKVTTISCSFPSRCTGAMTSVACSSRPICPSWRTSACPSETLPCPSGGSIASTRRTGSCATTPFRRTSSRRQRNLGSIWTSTQSSPGRSDTWTAFPSHTYPHHPDHKPCRWSAPQW